MISLEYKRGILEHPEASRLLYALNFSACERASFMSDIDNNKYQQSERSHNITRLDLSNASA